VASSGVALLLAGSIAAIELDPKHLGDPHLHSDVVYVVTIDGGSPVVTGAPLPRNLG
jgi:hypothetical protein